MIRILRRYYLVAAAIFGLIAYLSFGIIADSKSLTNSPVLFFFLMFTPWVIAAVILATRGCRPTTMWRVFICLYAVFLIPSGIYMFYSDVSDNIHDWQHRQWMNTGVWLMVSLEVGVIVSPFVFGFAGLVASVNNKLAARFDGGD